MTKLCLIAGGGHLPVAAARCAADTGFDLQIACLPGAFSSLASDYPSIDVAIDGFADLFCWLADTECRSVSFIGSIERPNLSGVDRSAMGMAGDVLASVRSDIELQAWLINLMEARGLSVLGAAEAFPGLLVSAGMATRHETLMGVSEAELSLAETTALRVGELDIGQGAVIVREVVLAVETQDGTDALLKRVADLPEPLRGTPQKREGVLFKALKPGQDPRLDLPVIGPATVELADAAGLAGICVSADNALIDQRSMTVKMAEDAGLFILGVPTSGKT